VRAKRAIRFAYVLRTDVLTIAIANHSQ